MNRLFLRFFVLVMLSVTLATALVYFATTYLFGDPLDQIARRQASAQVFLLEQYVDLAPADEWLVRLNKVREVSKVNLELIGLNDARRALLTSQHAALQRGEVVLDTSHKSFYRRVDLNGNRYIGSDTEVIRAQDLPIDIALAVQMEALRFVIVALVLLVPLGWWSRAHWRDLQHLARVTDQVGQGQLEARAALLPSASVYQLGERINAMAQRIAALLDAQKSLLHSVSHELRTPIARLGFALELLRTKADDPALESRIAAMEGDVAELDALVNELLAMIRLDSTEALKRAPFDLADAIQACVHSIPEPQATVELTLASNLGTIAADQRLLMRALSNLLRNAHKYADGRIRLSAQRLDDGKVELRVEDNGPGIPEQERARVWEPFYRMDRSRDRASGGFGLGLSIAQKAVALHGGAISIGQSALGGACMTITLPAQQ